jgi:hypothetical protein
MLTDRGLAVSQAAAAAVIEPVSAIARTVRRLCTSNSGVASFTHSSSHGMFLIQYLP